MGGKPSAVEDHYGEDLDQSLASRAERAAANAAADDAKYAELRSRKTLVLKGHTKNVNCLVALPGDELASGSEDKSIIIWSAVHGTLIRKLVGHEKAVQCLTKLADGRLASGSYDNSIIIWSLADGEQPTKLEGHTKGVKCLVALDGDRLRLASGSPDKSIIIWNLTDGTKDGEPLTQRLTGHADDVNCLAALAGGRLASGSDDHSVRIWSVADGKQLAKLDGHTGSIWSLAALGSKRLASCGGDKIIRIWDVAEGTLRTGAKPLKNLEGHTDLVSCMTVQGDRLKSCSRDNTIRIWNVAADTKNGEAPYNKGRALEVMWGQKGGIKCLVAFDDERIASGGGVSAIFIRNKAILERSTILIETDTCGSAFDFEQLAQKCRDKDMLDDLFDNANHHGLKNNPDHARQAHVLEAIATVVNEEEDAPRKKSIESLAPNVLDLVNSKNLMREVQRSWLQASKSGVEELASGPLFRVVLDAKFAAGPRVVLYLEIILFFALMFCFGRIAGFEKSTLGWRKWYPAEKIVLLVFGFAILFYFSVREILQMISARGIELAKPLPDNPLGSHRLGPKVTGLTWYALAIPRYALLFLVWLVQLPVYRMINKGENEYEARTLPEDIMNARKTARKEGKHFFFYLHSSFGQRIVHDPLTFVGLPRAWRLDYWNWIDVATFGCAWASFARAAMPGVHLNVNLAAATALLLWVKFLEFLKDFSFKFSKFVLMFEKVVKDLYIYIAFFFIILLMFATIFFLYLGDLTKHDYDHLGGDVFYVVPDEDGKYFKRDAPGDSLVPRTVNGIVNGTGFNGTGFNGTGFNGTGVNGTGVNGTGVNGTGHTAQDANHPQGKHTYYFDQKTGYTNFPNTLWSLYLLAFSGDFDLDIFYKPSLKIYLALFIFIVVIVLLNVLIAIVSNSHDGITDKIAAGLFYRSRLEYVAEVTSVFDLFRRFLGIEGPLLRRLPSWLSPENESEDSITKKLEKALEQHKDDVAGDDSDAARLAAIRDSEDRAKQKFAKTQKQLAELAATQKQILEMLKSLKEE